MSKNQSVVKAKILQELENAPIIWVAAKKAKVSRSTLYRWMDEDYDFKQEVEGAVEKGRDSINDLAESKIISMINKSDFPATKFWLQNNHENYITPRTKNTQKKRGWGDLISFAMSKQKEREEHEAKMKKKQT